MNLSHFVFEFLYPFIMDATLKYLYEEKGVKEPDMQLLETMGITSISRLALLEDTRAGAREAIRTTLGLDIATPDRRGRLISVLDA